LILADYGVYSKKFAERISKSAGLRNILIQDYNDTDRRILYASIQACLKDYETCIRRILAFLKRSPR
jgi:uncharacterized protein YutE (UPF0331/DUF86 family)